jgi:hypothetical protein
MGRWMLFVSINRMIMLATTRKHHLPRRNDTPPSPKRKRRRGAGCDRKSMASASCVGLLTILYVLFLYKTEWVLDSLDRNQDKSFPSSLVLGQNLRKRQKRYSNNNERFLFFSGTLIGQGQGNVVSGLLAAHLLGQEFDRIVCVHEYDNFLQAFDYANETVKRLCMNMSHIPPKSSRFRITLVNFAPTAPDECDLQERLRSDTPAYHIAGNTYPRWSAVPDNFFQMHYRPTPALLSVLPYRSRPTTVVHLRVPDTEYDKRPGLDDFSLNALGELLPKVSTTYLVTNWVEHYERFAKCCQWSHPPWNRVRHSAYGDIIDWGSLRHGDQKKKETTNIVTNKQDEKMNQDLQLWADWYTLLTAETVYHTPSDFSGSAVHWSNKRDSHVIRGYNATTGQLETDMEWWWRDGVTVPLKDRKRDALGTSALRQCPSAEEIESRMHMFDQVRKELMGQVVINSGEEETLLKQLSDE